MLVLVTGHQGYIGSVLVPRLQAEGHEVVGLDLGWFADCTLGPAPEDPSSIQMDLRDTRELDLHGFDAVIHLAALSNDSLGDIQPDVTYEINELGSVRLAEAAKRAGVQRFIYSSSCSLYGAAGDGLLNENAPFNPLTPYGSSKIRAEQGIARLADEKFSPTFMRNATAYGFSPRLRVDLMVNSLVGYAVTTGEVRILSDGTPWRPLVHVDDIAAAFAATLVAPLHAVHGQSFNVGRTDENYRVREVAEIVRQVVPGSRIQYQEGGAPDARNYRVDFNKIEGALKEFQPTWDVRRGVEQLYSAYREHGLSEQDFLGARYLRIKRIQELQAVGSLDENLRST